MAAWRRPLVECAGFQLEDNLGCQLELAGREGAADTAKRSVAYVAIRRLIVDFVEEVECFRAEVEVRTFTPERERFVQAEVGLVEGRPDNHVALRVAERAAAGWNRDARTSRSDHTGDRRRGGLDQVSGQCCDRLHPVGRRSNSRAGNVGTIRVQVRYVGSTAGAVGVCQVRGQAAGHRVDDGDLPSAQKSIFNVGSAATEAASLAKGQVVDDRGCVVQRLVVVRTAIVAAGVGEVDAGVVAVAGLEMSAGEVEGAAPGERIEQIAVSY